MHVHSDVFCSGSIILPDKGGRQLNVGGWSLDSTFGVRLYLPDGTDGVNGTNDWEEDYPALALQVCLFSRRCKGTIWLISRIDISEAVGTLPLPL